MSEQRRTIVALARAAVGLPCPWMGNGPLGDCSGIVQHWLRFAGVEPWASQFPAALDWRADELREKLPAVAGPDVLPGDLALYPGHVVMVTGVDAGVVVETIGASGTSSRLTTVQQALDARALVRRRVGPDCHLYGRPFLGFRRAIPG